MIIVDWIMRPADSYWKRQWKAEEIRRKAAEADAKCFRDTNDQLVETRNVLSERDIKQAMAIAALNREIQRLKDELDAKERTISDKDREIVLLHEALRSERDIKQAAAIAALNREIQRLKDELDAKEKTISDKDREIGLLHEALRSERDLSAALRTNSRLWENIKSAVKEGNA